MSDQLQLDDSHGGYEVGEEVVWENPMGVDRHLGTIAALHRNGNLLIRDPKFGTTVDVHHTHVERPTKQSLAHKFFS